MWVYNTEIDSMEMREVSYVPGVYKIFDEILVNAADNKQRDKNMDTIKVTVDREKVKSACTTTDEGFRLRFMRYGYTEP
jgi:DNA gyrase/topoisomerase IV subunit B